MDVRSMPSRFFGTGTSEVPPPTTRTTLIEPYPTLPEPPLSLPIRLERKKKRTRLGIMALVAGSILLAAGGYNFTVKGSELLAGWLTLMAAGALALGLSSLRRAAKSL